MKTRSLCPLLLTLIACSDQASEVGVTAHEEPEAAHHHEAPHGGTLVELGEHFANLELSVDAATGQVRAWIHDAHAENTIRVAMRRLPLAISLENGQRFDLLLEPVENVLTGEAPGDTSEFAGQSEQLLGVTSFHGVLPTVVIRGQTLLAVGFAYPSGEIVALQTKELK